MPGRCLVSAKRKGRLRIFQKASTLEWGSSTGQTGDEFSKSLQGDYGAKEVKTKEYATRVILTAGGDMSSPQGLTRNRTPAKKKNMEDFAQAGVGKKKKKNGKN